MPDHDGLREARSRLIYALDYPSLERARAGAERLRGHVGLVKVGLELFVRHGPEAIALGERAGAEVFLDLKLHDIPATVAAAVAGAAALGVRYLTVHACGGEAMLRAATASAAACASPPEIVAVTVLTSLDDADLSALGIAGPAGERARRWAELARRAGIGCFVCSPAEAASLRRDLGPEVTLITPGVRPAGADRGDQKRVMTPAAALAAGADLLVVGRPIRDAPDPVGAATAIAEQMAAALTARVPS